MKLLEDFNCYNAFKVTFSLVDLLLNMMHEQDNTESAAVDPIDLDNLRSTIIVRSIDQDLQRS